MVTPFFRGENWGFTICPKSRRRGWQAGAWVQIIKLQVPTGSCFSTFTWEGTDTYIKESETHPGTMPWTWTSLRDSTNVPVSKADRSFQCAQGWPTFPEPSWLQRVAQTPMGTAASPRIRFTWSTWFSFRSVWFSLKVSTPNSEAFGKKQPQEQGSGASQMETWEAIKQSLTLPNWRLGAFILAQCMERGHASLSEFPVCL